MVLLSIEHFEDIKKDSEMALRNFLPVIVCWNLMWTTSFIGSQIQGKSDAEVLTREIESSVDDNHCTTRQFQHMTFYHEGVWFATDQTPYDLMITYGIQKHVGRDKRERTGVLYARRFDGKQWRGNEILLSQPESIHNWYPNINQDISNGLCLMYSRSVDHAHLGKPLAVMVSVCQPKND